MPSYIFVERLRDDPLRVHPQEQDWPPCAGWFHNHLRTVHRVSKVRRSRRVPTPNTYETLLINPSLHRYGDMPPGLMDDVKQTLKRVENSMGLEFGSTSKPLLLSVRSGSRESMPGMMDTVLNVGLNSTTVVGLAKMANNEHFAYDSYRRLIQVDGGSTCICSLCRAPV